MAESIIKEIYPDDIIFGAGTQARVRTDIKTCQAYIESMRCGDEFPPIDVFNDGTSSKYVIADGFHRYDSNCSFRPGEPIKCRVHHGTVDDARWFAITANKTHGLRRTNEDKRKAVKMALLHQKSQSENMSDRAIAELVGVDPKTVSAMRAKLESTGEIPQSFFRMGKDGRMINTANIGGKGKYPHLDEPPEPESHIRTNADGKEVNTKGFEFRYHYSCDQCGHWSRETGLCDRDDSSQPSWTPACSDWRSRLSEIAPDKEPHVIRHSTRPIKKSQRTNSSKASYVRQDHIDCPIYPENPELSAAKIREMLGSEFLGKLIEAARRIEAED